MNEELENVLNSDTPQNQNGQTVEIESESSVVGIIFTVLAWLNMLIGIVLLCVELSKNYSFDRDYSLAISVLGSSLFLFAVASCLNFLAKISFRMGCIMRAVEK